jgi:hypothetical protein
MVMPNERALELDELYFLAVELTNDLRTPMLVDESEFLG